MHYLIALGIICIVVSLLAGVLINQGGSTS